MPRRKVANTPLAKEIDALVERFGSDEKLATEIGHGATRYAVMRWRVNGASPEKTEYVKRLTELGIDEELLLSQAVQQPTLADLEANQRQAFDLLRSLSGSVEKVSKATNDLVAKVDDLRRWLEEQQLSGPPSRSTRPRKRRAS